MSGGIAMRVLKAHGITEQLYAWKMSPPAELRGTSGIQAVWSSTHHCAPDRGPRRHRSSSTTRDQAPMPAWLSGIEKVCRVRLLTEFCVDPLLILENRARVRC